MQEGHKLSEENLELNIVVENLVTYGNFSHFFPTDFEKQAFFRTKL